MAPKESDKEETAVECIGEVEVAAVPDVKEDQDAAADDGSKKTASEKEEVGKDKSEEGSDKATEKQKETDTDQASHSLITVKTKDS